MSIVDRLRAIKHEFYGVGPLELLRAFLISPLPRRYWGGASGVGLLFSGLAQIALCGAGLIQAYDRYSQPVSEALAKVSIEAAVSGEATRVSATPAMAFGALTPLAFFAVSISGRFFAYGVFSGFVRVVSYAADHPCGDPLLTFVDEFVWDGIYGVRSALRRAALRMRSR